MKAIVVHEYGGPEVLKYENYPDPVPGAGEVLVRVAAASVNPIDYKRRAGLTKDFYPLQFPGLIGVDMSGTVLKIGPGVDGFSVGDKVFAMADNTYAELCVVKAAVLAKVPEGLDLIDAAALPLVTVTGNQLATATEIKAGQTVLITGAVGNVARSAVFTAKQLGAKVIAGVLKKQLEEVKSVGADQGVATDDDSAIANLPLLDAVADAVDGSNRPNVDRQGQAGRSVCIGGRCATERREVSSRKGGNGILAFRQENSGVYGRCRSRRQTGDPNRPQAAAEQGGRRSGIGGKGRYREGLAGALNSFPDLRRLKGTLALNSLSMGTSVFADAR